MGSEITLRDVYEEQRETRRELSEVRTDVATIVSDLAHGEKRMNDQENRIRALEHAAWRAVGAAAAVGTLTGGIAGSVLAHVWH